MFSSNIILLGREIAAPEKLQLRAGPFTMFFEPDTVFLRHICLGGQEVIRGVYAAVRDRNWGTVTPRIENFSSDVRNDCFELRFTINCRQGEIHFAWTGLITGTSDGAIRFEFDGVARSTFLRNRIGFCVLHPLIACAGQSCKVEHTDGVLESGTFPLLVSPHQPFNNIRMITYHPSPGMEIETHLEGDTFEMEDQRNWTDASFKTYCTPIEIPFPVQVEEGTRIQQSVTIKIQLDSPLAIQQGSSIPIESLDTDPIIADIAAKPVHRLPPLGLGLATHDQSLTTEEVKRLRLLHLNHLRADIEFAKTNWIEVLRRASKEAQALNCSLHLALHLTKEAEDNMRQLLAEMSHLQSRVSLVLVFHADETSTSASWTELASRALHAYDPAIEIAAGTNANFAELNRARPPADANILPCFSINPQVHAFDELSLMENLEAQEHVVKTAHTFSDKPVVISPVTLKRRFNVVATGKEAPVAPGQLPPQVDPRQMSLFGAAWTLGSIIHLARTGHVHSLTYYETTGWRGLMETPAGSAVPEKYHSSPGAVFPLFYVFALTAGYTRFADLRELIPGAIVGCELFDEDGNRRVLLANLLPAIQNLSLRVGNGPVGVGVLDHTTAEESISDPVTFLGQTTPGIMSHEGLLQIRLQPYALVWLNVGAAETHRH